MRYPAPQRPRDIDPLAEALLTRLQSYPAARHIVLGGYFALKHYHDYRITHDVDAWWAEESRELDREQVRAALKAVLESLASEQGLAVNRRRFGDTESWEFVSSGSKVFSFHISGDAEAEASRHLHEIELRRPLDTLTDPAQREQARQTRDWFRAVFLQPSQA